MADWMLAVKPQQWDIINVCIHCLNSYSRISPHQGHVPLWDFTKEDKNKKHRTAFKSWKSYLRPREESLLIIMGCVGCGVTTGN